MGTKILVGFGVMKKIEEKMKVLGLPTSQPTIRRALSGATPKKSKQNEYKLIRAIALELEGAELKK